MDCRFRRRGQTLSVKPLEQNLEDPMKTLMMAAVVIVWGVSASAQDIAKTTTISPDTLAWKDAPSLPKGAKFVILAGDPTKPGSMVIQRLKLPPNYQVPPHTHTHVVFETVLTGSMGFGMGDKLDTQKGEMLKSGSLLLMPPGHAHYVWTGNEETIFQLQTLGPIGIDYVNPADDPRKK